MRRRSPKDLRDARRAPTARTAAIVVRESGRPRHPSPVAVQPPRDAAWPLRQTLRRSTLSGGYSASEISVNRRPPSPARSSRTLSALGTSNGSRSAHSTTFTPGPARSSSIPAAATSSGSSR